MSPMEKDLAWALALALEAASMMSNEWSHDEAAALVRARVDEISQKYGISPEKNVWKE